MTTPESIVQDAMSRLAACVHEGDVDGAASLFHDDGVFFGAGQGQSGDGMAELRAFFERIFASHGSEWSWDAPIVRSTEDAIWFVATGTLTVRRDGEESSSPYRQSGVLERRGDGLWLFSLFNGAIPAGSPPGPSQKD